jgi:hypothetical protein
MVWNVEELDKFGRLWGKPYWLYWIVETKINLTWNFIKKWYITQFYLDSSKLSFQAIVWWIIIQVWKIDWLKQLLAVEQFVKLIWEDDQSECVDLTLKC